MTLRKRIIPSLAAILIGSMGLAAACVPGGSAADDQQAADDADDEAGPDAGVGDDYSGGWPFPTIPCPFPNPGPLCDPGPTDGSGKAAQPDDGV